MLRMIKKEQRMMIGIVEINSDLVRHLSTGIDALTNITLMIDIENLKEHLL